MTLDSIRNSCDVFLLAPSYHLLAPSYLSPQTHFLPILCVTLTELNATTVEDAPRKKRIFLGIFPTCSIPNSLFGNTLPWMQKIMVYLTLLHLLGPEEDFVFTNNHNCWWLIEIKLWIPPPLFGKNSHIILFYSESVPNSSVLSGTARKKQKKKHCLEKREGIQPTYIKIEHQNSPLLLFNIAHNNMLLFEQKSGIRWYLRFCLPRVVWLDPHLYDTVFALSIQWHL